VRGRHLRLGFVCPSEVSSLHKAHVTVWHEESYFCQVSSRTLLVVNSIAFLSFLFVKFEKATRFPCVRVVAHVIVGGERLESALQRTLFLYGLARRGNKFIKLFGPSGGLSRNSIIQSGCLSYVCVQYSGTSGSKDLAWLCSGKLGIGPRMICD